LELGVGSGVVLGTLACRRPLLEGVGVELSPQALEVAAGNLEKLGVARRIQLRQGSWFQPIQDSHDGRFHMIVSNPPYISREEMRRLPASVLMEPAIALYGGEDGLNAYRDILKDAPRYLCPAGWALFEIGWKQAGAVEELLKNAGMEALETVQDAGGRDRVAAGRRAKRLNPPEDAAYPWKP
jgi:release factor glutamine methyltransferase